MRYATSSPHRDKERSRSRTVRCVHRCRVNGRRINSVMLVVMHNDDSIVTIEGLAAPEALHLLQAALIERYVFPARIPYLLQICSAIGMLAEADLGWPSHVTADLAQKHIASVRCGDPGAHERQHLSLRCVPQHLVAAIFDVVQRVQMSRFTYERARDARETGAALL